MATIFTDMFHKSVQLYSSLRPNGVHRVECAAKVHRNANQQAKSTHISPHSFDWTMERITENEISHLVSSTIDFIAEKVHRKMSINGHGPHAGHGPNAGHGPKTGHGPNTGQHPKTGNDPNIGHDPNTGHDTEIGKFNDWEKLYDRHGIHVWRKPTHVQGIYEYKAYGSFNDITPEAFFRVQVDIEYRKQWDKFTAELDVIDYDDASDNEVHYWIMNYGYPLTRRDYVYVRRFKIDHDAMTMAIVSRATNHPSRPEHQDHVRVTDYRSAMVIFPHTNFKEKGLDFMLSFMNSPKATIPSYCMNIITEFTGIPGMINTFYDAAKKQKKM